MSSDREGWFKRWGKEMPFGPWSYADVEEMMKEMERDFMEMQKTLPKHLAGERRGEGNVSKERGPIVFGYSVTVGPDGKPVVREFGNVRRGPSRETGAISDSREPLVDIVEGDREVRVIAEMPGASKDGVIVTTKGRILSISTEPPGRKYQKEVEIPTGLDTGKVRSSFNNGVLQVTIPKKRRARIP